MRLTKIFLTRPPKALDDDETELLEKVENVRLVKKFIYSVIHRFFVSDFMWLWRWKLMKMEVEEQWRREKRVVDEKECAERKIYVFFGLEIGMECYK